VTIGTLVGFHFWYSEEEPGRLDWASSLYQG